MDEKDNHIQEEIAILWTNAHSAVAAFVSSIVPRFQDADDIIQQVAVAVIKNYDKFDKDRPFVAWAIGIARNEILMYHRNNSQRKLMFSVGAIQTLSEVYETETTKLGDMREALNVCITKLKGRAKRILEMRYLSELSIPRIAQKLGMTHSAVYTTFHRIRIALRDCIIREMSSGELNDV